MSHEPTRTALPRMLVVDDEEWLGEMMRMALHEEYETVIASSGEVGLEVFGGEHFDVIITDVVMGRMDGLRFVTEVRKQRSDVPVLVISGAFDRDALIDTLADTLSLGQTSFLAKPFTVEELRRAVAEVMRSGPDKPSCPPGPLEVPADSVAQG